MKIIITLFILILNIFIFQAQTITGKIVNALTKEPIALATIQVDKDNGTISNIDGVFNLKITKNNKTATISCIGYRSKTIAIKDWKKTIYLEESITEMEEINLSEKKLTVQEIIEKVKENYASNYSNWNDTQYKIFKRTQNTTKLSKLQVDIDKSKNYNKELIKKLNDTLDSLKQPFINYPNKSFEDVLYHYMQNEKGAINGEIEQATLLNNPELNFSMEKLSDKFLNVFKTLYTDKTFKVKISLFKVEDSLKMPDDKELKQPKIYSLGQVFKTKQLYTNLVKEENDLLDEILNPKKYKYTILNTLYFKDELVYEIDFDPKKGSSKYKGKFYVSDESFAILKLNYNMLHNKKLEGVNLKLIGLKYKVYDYKGTIIYHKINTKYVPQYIKQHKITYNYVRIPVKFIENTKEKDKLKFKLKTLMESTASTNQEYLFLKTERLNKEKFKANIEKIKKLKEAGKKIEGFPVKMIKKYDSSIWKKYNVIAPTYKILEFD